MVRIDAIPSLTRYRVYVSMIMQSHGNPALLYALGIAKFFDGLCYDESVRAL